MCLIGLKSKRRPSLSRCDLAMCFLQVEIKSAAFVSVLTQLADTPPQTKELTVMHTAHGERRKVFPVLLTSEHVTVKNTPPPPLQPIAALYMKKDFWPVGFSVLLPTLLGLVD